MVGEPDTTYVELHRAERRLRVVDVEGGAWFMKDADALGASLVVGSKIEVGQVIALAPGARVRVGSLWVEGGKRGRAHSFVPGDAFQSTPSRRDVPKLLRDLDRLAEHIAREGSPDPLAAQVAEGDSFERLLTHDFALHNLDLSVARGLPEAVAEAERAVPLFVSGEAVCVAMEDLSVRKIAHLMRVLDRPINPYVVGPETLERLLERAYRWPADRA